MLQYCININKNELNYPNTFLNNEFYVLQYISRKSWEQAVTIQMCICDLRSEIYKIECNYLQNIDILCVSISYWCIIWINR